MAKKKSDPKGDFDLTVPQADISLEDIPISQEKLNAASFAALFHPTPEATRRAKIFQLFVKAKQDGLAVVAHLWPPRSKRRGRPDFLETDLAQREWLIEQMVLGLTLFEACKKAVAESRVGGLGTSDSTARRLFSRFPLEEMETEASRRRQTM